MASRPTSSRSSSRSGSSRRGTGRGRSSSSSNANQMPLVLGGVGVLVVIVLLVVMNSGGGAGEQEGGQSNPPAKTGSKAPAAARTELAPGSARSGKTPGRPAPALTAAMLEQARSLLQEAKELNREGTTQRNAGDNNLARDTQSAAKVKIDEIKRLLDAPLTWQEEADLEGWSQPAEYGTLEKLYVQIASVEKRVRMGGGTR